MRSPVLFVQPLLDFPYSILQLQADIRRVKVPEPLLIMSEYNVYVSTCTCLHIIKCSYVWEDITHTQNGIISRRLLTHTRNHTQAMDKYEVAHETTPSKVTHPGTLANNRNTFPNTTQTLVQVANKFTSHPQAVGTPSLSFPQLRMGEDSFMKHFLDDIDTEIRISFVDFLFSAEVLGLVDQHLCIYRLFPRPVVTLRKSAFLRAYQKTVATSDTRFVRGLIQSQVGMGVWVW